MIISISEVDYKVDQLDSEAVINEIISDVQFDIRIYTDTVNENEISKERAQRTLNSRNNRIKEYLGRIDKFDIDLGTFDPASYEYQSTAAKKKAAEGQLEQLQLLVSTNESTKDIVENNYDVLKAQVLLEMANQYIAALESRKSELKAAA